jgi:hypothetical protein
MSIMIEEGKYYVDRNGDRIGPMHPTGQPVLAWCGYDMNFDCYSTYRNDGRFNVGVAPCGSDLVAEWVEPAPAPDVAKALAEALEKSRVYVGMVRSSDIADDDPIFGVMDEIDAALALYREGRS